jgi:hypothetical protein
MNCQDFNAVVGELADGRTLEAAARGAGLEHAAVCAACSARLMAARAVGAALSVASREETEEAPARVKRALLTAFAEQRKVTAAHASGVAPAPVVELTSRRAPRWWGVAVAAAAAVVLLSLALPSLVGVSPDASQVPPPDMSAEVKVPSEPAPTAIESGVVPPASKETTQGGASKNIASRARKHSSLTRGSASSKNEAVAQNVGNDYLPLTYLDAATAIESGTVVRVKLSRSALISLGVPVGVERADELMKAEVVLGDDGVARAIRLVR